MNYLLRHSIDDDTKKGGWSASPLTAKGIFLAYKAKPIIERLPINCIVCSDIVRTKETADIINLDMGLPLYYEHSLRELNVGVASGMTYKEIDRLYPITENTYLDMNFKYPGGETLGEFKKRVLDFYYNVICKCNNTLFVTHRNVISVIYNEINGTTWDFNDKTSIPIGHCSLFEVDDKHIKRIHEREIYK